MSVYFKAFADYKSAIIVDGCAYEFDRYGKISKEEQSLIPQYLHGAIKVSVISVISHDDRVEIALFEGDNPMIRFEVCTCFAVTLLSDIIALRGYSHCLNRQASVSTDDDNISIPQAIFIYPFEYDVMTIVKRLGAKEVME